MIKLADPRNRIGGYYQPPDPPADDDDDDDRWDDDEPMGCLGLLAGWFVFALVGTVVVLMLLKCVRVAWEILWQ